MSAANLSEDASLIYNYMYQTNRPYSALQVFENLHERVKKGQVPVIMDQLVEDGLLVGKLYGKSKVYHMNQDIFPPAEDDANAGEGAEAAQARAAAAKREHDALVKRLAELEAEPETEDAEKELAKLTKENAANRARLATLTRASAGVNVQDLDKRKKALYGYVRAWRTRRKACYDMMDVYLENVTKTRKAFMREQGVETDEEAKVDVKAFTQKAEEWGCHKIK